MIFAAGLGTRLKPYTDTQPKALVELGEKTILEGVISKLKNAGVRELVINVHHFSGQIIQYLQNHHYFNLKIHISDESDFLLDTGGGLKKASPLLQGKEPVILYNVDIFSDIDLKKIIAFHRAENALATIVVRQRKTQRYLMFDSTMQLTGWKNTASGETKISLPEAFKNAIPMAFSGIHIVNPEIFPLILHNGKFSIIDVYLDLAKKHRIVGYCDNSGFWMDLGKPEQLMEANRMVKNAK